MKKDTILCCSPSIADSKKPNGCKMTIDYTKRLAEKLAGALKAPLPETTMQQLHGLVLTLTSAD